MPLADFNCHRWHVWAFLILAVVVRSERDASAEDADGESPRRTSTVKVIERVLPSVVSLRTAERVDEGVRIHFGSGAIVHPEGYILTNAHVIRNPVGGDVLLSDDRVLPFRTLIRFIPEDLAIVKVNPPGPLVPVSLGRSNDLMLGEPAVVIGSPTGLARSVSTGIISGLGRATRTEFAFLPSMVQTTAATNGGNSGGPLLNALGEQIGIVTSRDANSQNISFAIVIDHVRTVLPTIIAAEQRMGFRLGIDVDTLAPNAAVTRVDDGSPAAQAGIAEGDVLTQLNGSILRHGVDFHLKLLEQRPGASLAIKYRRDGTERETNIELTPLTAREAEPVESVAPGLLAEVYPGSWERVPNVTSLKPVHTQVLKRANLDELAAWKDQFAVRLTGYIKIPRDDLYLILTRSDDGSRLLIGDDVVVDNDGFHAAKDAGGLRRLKAGYHPLTLTFFEGQGAQELRLLIESANLPMGEVPAEWLFHKPPTNEQPAVPAPGATPPKEKKE